MIPSTCFHIHSALLVLSLSYTHSALLTVSLYKCDKITCAGIERVTFSLQVACWLQQWQQCSPAMWTVKSPHPTWLCFHLMDRVMDTNTGKKCINIMGHPWALIRDPSWWGRQADSVMKRPSVRYSGNWLLGRRAAFSREIVCKTRPPTASHPLPANQSTETMRDTTIALVVITSGSPNRRFGEAPQLCSQRGNDMYRVCSYFVLWSILSTNSDSFSRLVFVLLCRWSWHTRWARGVKVHAQSCG
jgi:hypothetical protein